MCIARAAGFWILVLAIAIGSGGCAGSEDSQPTQARPIARGAPPAYADVAQRYNGKLVGTDQLIARANIKLTYFDKDGEPQTETPEGTLQIVRTPPMRVALSLGKAGQTVFWFGCNGDTYWWLDLSDKNDRIAAVGKLSAFDDPAGLARKRLGLAIQPTDLVQLLGIVPLNTSAPGRVDWTSDGQFWIVSAWLSNDKRDGFQRLVVEPSTLVTRTVELFDGNGQKVLVGEHDVGRGGVGLENVQITRTGVPDLVGARPRVPGRVTAHHLETGTEIRLTLTGVRDGPMSEKAFQLDELKRKLGVDREIDLDSASVATGPGR